MDIRLPSGVTLRFPDGTDPAVIQRAVQQASGGSPTPAPGSGAAAGQSLFPMPDRSVQQIVGGEAPAAPNPGLPPNFMQTYQQGVGTHFQPNDPNDPTPDIVGDNRLNRGQFASAVQGGTLNLGDELAGLLGGVGGMIDPNRTFGEGFRGAREAYNGDLNYARELDPGGTTFGGLLGGLMTGGLGAGRAGLSLLSGAKPTVASIVSRAGAEGAAYGGIAGAAEGDSLSERLQNLLMGLGTGGVAGAAGGAALGPAAVRAAREGVPSTAQISQQARTAYENADNLGVSMTGDARTRLDQAIAEGAQAMGASSGKPATHAFLTALARGDSRATPGVPNPPSELLFSEIEGIRQQINRLRQSPDAGEAAVAGGMIRALDNYIDTMPARDVLQAFGGDAGEAMRFLREGRRLWAVRSKSEEVQEAMRVADLARNATTDSEAYRNSLRTQFRAIARDDQFTTRWTPEEQRAILDVVQGSTPENALRWLGDRLAPGGPLTRGQIIGGLATGGVGAGTASMLGGGGGGTAGAGIAALLIPELLGRGARGASRSLGNNTGTLADLLIRGQGNMPRPAGGAGSALAGALMGAGSSQIPWRQ